MDVIVIGGGIVGLATSYRLLQRFPDTRLLLLEKEEQLAMHRRQAGADARVVAGGK